MRAVVAITLFIAGVVVLSHCGCAPVEDDEATTPTEPPSLEPVDCSSPWTLEQIQGSYQ